MNSEALTSTKTSPSPLRVTRLGLGDLATYLNRQKEKILFGLINIAVKEL